MKKSLTLVLMTLLLVVLGCNMDRLTGGSNDEVPTPATENGSDSGAETTSASPDDSGDTSSTSTESGSADVSMEKFNKIELGMSYDEVKEVMGSEGNQTSMTKSGSYESSSYEWKGEKFARISVRFTRSELSYKSQSGLTPASGDAAITQAKFNKIETGMSYDEVKEIIGSDGELTSESKIGNYESASYRWKGPNYSNIFVNFRDGKLQNKTQSNLK
ncbi:MAG TPA: DUF3862 domain-containing protein [Aridibacter sp.]|nr:DUF3862 domain-containing protein [Aridibacter sp.]